jgi:radical SAM-linked protein
MTRLRFRFSKIGKVRFTSARDVARLWERALRRTALPLAMTEGFSPRPKVHFGLALSTGHESLAEYLDVDLDDHDRDASDSVQLALLPEQLTALLPPGLTVEAVAEIDRREPSLQQAVTSCTWQIDFGQSCPPDLPERTERLLARTSVPITRERKGQLVHDDLRPSVLALSVHGTMLDAELATQPRGVRPAELLSAFDPPLVDPITTGGRVCRTQQWIISADGARREPLSRDATPAPHAEVRAS